MNIILFQEQEIYRPLPLADRRAVHMLNTLHAKAGDRFKAGIVDGSMGVITIDTITDTAIQFHFAATQATVTMLFDVGIIIGHPRPPATKRIVKDLTTIGVKQIDVFIGENSESSYRKSNIWNNNYLHRALIEGAEQAGATALPRLSLNDSLRSALIARKSYTHYTETINLFCDIPHDTTTDIPPLLHILQSLIKQIKQRHARIVPQKYFISVAIGPERGWSENERDILRAHDFMPIAISNRILRTETTASIAASFAVDLLLALNQ